MGKSTGFLDYKRENPNERDVRHRLQDWKEYEKPSPEKVLQRQGARCMDCGTPYCHIGIEFDKSSFGCPLHNLIPEWNDLVYRGQWKEALERLEKTNNFPEFTGRVCPAPCEGSCTVALNDDPVTIKSIEKSIIDKGFEEGWIVPRPPEERTGKKVAVIGSGPAGLAAAAQLNQTGHLVTVFEREDRPGGLLTYGIPNMKLEKELVWRRIELLKQEGILFQLNTEVGKDMTYEELRSEHDAVIICTGSAKQRDLKLKGRNLNGVHYAMEFLRENTRSLLNSNLKDGQYISAEGKNVIVIGGGDTGADCVATALRHKCKSVVQFGKHPKLPRDRTDKNPWPQQPQVFTFDYAYKEAQEVFGEDPRKYSMHTLEFVGDEKGNLKELHSVRTKKEMDENDEVTITQVVGTEKVWPVDLVFIAIGFEGPEGDLIQHIGLEQTERGNIKAEYGKYTTKKDGVFAAGDVRRGQSLIVWAINEGREAARECDRYLMKTTALP